MFAANNNPQKNDAFKAVLSRCDIFQLDATNDEVVEMMRNIAANGYNGITPDDATIVRDSSAEHAADRPLFLRLLGPSLKKFTYALQEGVDWPPLVDSQL